MVNESASPLRVTYAADPAILWPGTGRRHCLLTPPYVEVPQVFALDDVRRGRVSDTRPAGEYGVDKEACRVSLTLGPREGVLVWESITYEEGDERDFLTSLELVGSGSEVRYQGRDLQRHFVRRSKLLYWLPFDVASKVEPSRSR